MSTLTIQTGATAPTITTSLVRGDDINIRTGTLEQRVERCTNAQFLAFTCSWLAVSITGTVVCFIYANQYIEASNNNEDQKGHDIAISSTLITLGIALGFFSLAGCGALLNQSSNLNR